MKATGTYALLLRLEEGQKLAVGRLGSLPFPPGYYLYVSSARGPGGLGARLARHLWRSKPSRWHIDYLTSKALPLEVWTISSGQRWECLWAKEVRRLPGAHPLPGLGASDCNCPSHLFYFQGKPDWQELAQRLRRNGLPSDLNRRFCGKRIMC